MSGTWQEVRDWIGAEVGYGESPKGSNKTKFAAMAGHQEKLAWCATFVSAALKVNQVPGIPRKVLVASSRTMHAEAKAAKLAVPVKNCQPGDVLHMTRGPLRLWLGHVGFCIGFKGDKIVSIEGNTNGRGSATGGSVLIHTRPASDWNLGAWRPPYVKAAPKVVLWALPDGAIVRVSDGQRPQLIDGPTFQAHLAAGVVPLPHPPVPYDR